jgi:hypothetical protein
VLSVWLSVLRVVWLSKVMWVPHMLSADWMVLVLSVWCAECGVMSDVLICADMVNKSGL